MDDETRVRPNAAPSSSTARGPKSRPADGHGRAPEVRDMSDGLEEAPPGGDTFYAPTPVVPFLSVGPSARVGAFGALRSVWLTG